MDLLKKLRNSFFLALGLMLLVPMAGSLAGPAANLFGVSAAQAQTVRNISVVGNKRVDAATVISYLTIRPGDRATSTAIAASTNALLSTGLFSSVNIRMAGSTLRVTVGENSIVGAVLFEGNRALSDKELLSLVDLAAQGVFTKARLDNDVKSIKLAYENQGYKDTTVTARTEAMDNGRIKVVFQIKEGDRAKIASIAFSGNTHFSADQLRSVITTHETGWLSWLFRDDTFSQDQLNVDSEMVRLFYANHGYPDAQVLSAVSEYDATKNAYFITFTINEGDKYTFGNIGIETSIAGLNTDALKGDISTDKGKTFSSQALQNSVQDMTVDATNQGFPFASVRPRTTRNIADHTFDITYLVDQGPRVYVQRINITGNTKTRDFVIRRELDFAEGDPFNRTLVARAKSNIENLGYFKSVSITTAPGSAPDKVILNIAVVEQATGQYGFTAGFASDQGILGEISVTERNFLGKGQYLKVALGASQSGKTFDFAFTEPRFMGLKVSSGIDIYRRIVDESANGFYGTDTWGGRLRVGVPLTRELTSTFYVGYDHATYNDGDGNSQVVTDGEVLNTGILGYRLVYSTLDDKRNPTDGFYATLEQEYHGIDVNFLKSEIKARYFVPLFDDSGFVASIKGQAGVINDLSGSGAAAEQTFFPGPNLVRGFKTYGLGARTAAGEALGATLYAGLSAELDFPLPIIPRSYGLKGAVWADVGYVGDPSSAVSGLVASGTADPLRSSIGSSLIWESPFGPLRGDFAYVLNHDTGDKTQWFAFTLSTLL